MVFHINHIILILYNEVVRITRQTHLRFDFYVIYSCKINQYDVIIKKVMQNVCEISIFHEYFLSEV